MVLIAGNELELAYIRGNLDATRVETGYCFKPLKMECPFVEITWFTCHNHVTTTDFLPQFQRQERDLIEQIDQGTVAGRPHWFDKSQKKLKAIRSVSPNTQRRPPADTSKAATEGQVGS